MGDDEEWSNRLIALETLDEDGGATFELPYDDHDSEAEKLVVLYPGNQNIRSGRAKVAGQ